MGCAPSIHVSQSGVFYCRDEIREGSSPRPRPSSPSEIVGHIHTSSDSGSHISTSSSSRNRGIIKKGQNSHRGSSIEAETQTYDTRTMDTSKVKSVCVRWPTLCLAIKSYSVDIFAEVCFFVPS